MTRKKIGTICVDSGQIAIVDPCYVLDGKAYEAACLDTKNVKEHVFAPPYGTGVVVSSNGDGTHPVFIEFDDDNRPHRIVIDLEGP